MEPFRRKFDICFTRVNKKKSSHMTMKVEKFMKYEKQTPSVYHRESGRKEVCVILLLYPFVTEVVADHSTTHFLFHLLSTWNERNCMRIQ
jgi:hypothetical protein